MTIIEFFDRESHVENIISALLCAPDNVIFIGDCKKRIDKLSRAYEKITKSRGINVKFNSKPVNRNSLKSITNAIEEIIDEHDDCIIDLSGGDDLSLVAVGIVYAGKADKIKLHRFNITSNTMTDCDSDGVLCKAAPLELTVEEIVEINGGRIIYTDEKPNGTYKWNFTNDFAEDINSMWSVCKQNPTAWNTQLGILGRLLVAQDERESLNVDIDLVKAKETLLNQKVKDDVDIGLYKKLYRYGVIENLRTDSRNLCFRFKNTQIKKCLTKAGQVFELFLTISARKIKDENGKPYYTDVLLGAFIDWDGKIQPGTASDIENEIDIILMKGLMPVFISCKNGSVTIDELYKLSVVAKKFGGKYANKVLAATEIDSRKDRVDFVKIRAEAMNIKPFTEIHKMSNSEIEKELKNLWKTN